MDPSSLTSLLPGVQFVVCHALVHPLVPVLPDLSDNEDIVLDLVPLLPLGRPPVLHCKLALLCLQDPPVLQPLVLDVRDSESLASPEEGVSFVDVLVADGDGEHRPRLDAESMVVNTDNDVYSGDLYSGNDGNSDLNPPDEAILFTVIGITAIADKIFGDFH